MRAEIYNNGEMIFLEGNLKLEVKKPSPVDNIEVRLSESHENKEVSCALGWFESEDTARDYAKLWERVLNKEYEDVRSLVQISDNGETQYRVIYRDGRQEKLKDFAGLKARLEGDKK